MCLYVSGATHSHITHNYLQVINHGNSHLRVCWSVPKWEGDDSEWTTQLFQDSAGDFLAWVFLDCGTSVMNQD